VSFGVRPDNTEPRRAVRAEPRGRKHLGWMVTAQLRGSSSSGPGGVLTGPGLRGHECVGAAAASSTNASTLTAVAGRMVTGTSSTESAAAGSAHRRRVFVGSAWDAARMTGTRDWLAWHEPYADEGSELSRRLRLVQGQIAGWLDERPGERLTIVSVCAGQGRDLIGVLAGRSGADRVRATLLERDPGNVAAARAATRAAGLGAVRVERVDAGDRASYVGAVPADLVLVVGVFGNISDADVHGTVEALPELCGPGATVIWTRGRRAPDLTPDIRRWLTETGFVERAFHAPDDAVFSVGVHRFVGRPRPLQTSGSLFRFIS